MTDLRMGVRGGSRGEAGGGPLAPPLAAGLVFFASGAVLVIEVAGLRLVAPYLGVTLQTSSAVIGLALAGIAVGAWSGGRFADQAGPRRLLPIVLVLAGVVTCVTLPLVRFTGPSLASRDPVSVTILAFIAVFAPSVFLSSVPPMVVKLQLRDLDRTGTIVGRFSSLGTLGAIIATFLTGFVLLATLPTTAIILGLGGLTVLIGLALGFTPGSWRRPPAMLVLGALLGLLLPPLVPTPCGVETAYHCATVVSDPARPTGRYLVMDSLLHSYVDLADPRFLLFSYIQALASTVDVMRPPGQPLRVLHLGAGGLTMPRYLAATRPGSSSRVLEVDPGVIALDSSQLALGRVPNLKVDVEDARLGLKDEAAGGRDLVIGDAFGGLAVPWQLTTREVVSAVARILGAHGVYAVNVIDNPPNRFAHAEAATIAAVFPAVAVVADASALSGSGGGNFVILASEAPLPLPALQASLAGRGSGLEVASGARFAGFTRGADVLTDDQAPVDQLLTPTHR
ncbi:MAG: fused MFS/spermidine synthase [Candidatus Dormibacteraeota bacterium]|nr:fused MFS/spermidine synthase [Candidatus Dormibacteraeota bacterium]